MDWGVALLFVAVAVGTLITTWARAKDVIARRNSVYTPEVRRLMGLGKAAEPVRVDEGDDGDGSSSA